MYTTAKDTKPQDIKDCAGRGDSHPFNDAKEALRDIKNDVQDAVARSDWENIARRTGSEARKLADSAGHNLTDAGQALTVKIREKPVQWSLAALAVGLVVGRLFRR